jgi:hypothetical protein
MNKNEILKNFTLARDGDERERELWGYLCSRFPSYQEFWQQFIVRLTNRVVPNSTNQIELRPNVPEPYEAVSMAQYSVFYFLGRAAKRLAEDPLIEAHPEDVFFLLASAGDNFKLFMMKMSKLLHVKKLFPGQFPKDYGPFDEIKAYRDSLLHNPVIAPIHLALR